MCPGGKRPISPRRRHRHRTVNGPFWPPGEDTLPAKASGRLIFFVFSALLAAAPPASARGSPHWAFQPLRKVEVPGVSRPASAGTPIDRFLLSALESRRLTFSPEAERATLIRRVHLDLWG